MPTTLIANQYKNLLGYRKHANNLQEYTRLLWIKAGLHYKNFCDHSNNKYFI
jgi:hypothetical protein